MEVNTQMIVGNKLFLTQDELALQLGKSVETLRRWRRLGQGPAYIKVGNQVAYDPEKVTAHFEGTERQVSRAMQLEGTLKRVLEPLFRNQTA
jgi:hypothetical protein